MFDTLWRFVLRRHITVVQECSELEHVFNLIQGCGSYLEIGTAEGNSLYVLAHALKPGAKITSVDLGENHTRPYVNEVIGLLNPEYTVARYTGDSTKPDTYPQMEKHEVVLIDGGHDYDTVLSDCRMYAPLATKYLLFHDVMLPDVRRAMNDFLNNFSTAWHYSEFINSPTMGYGIVEIL